MIENKRILTARQFYSASWTWGIIMSLIGAIVIGAIKLYGLFTHQAFKLKKCGYCYYLNIGKNWGGVELGMFFLCDNSNSESTMWHEHGHAIQNCFWGPLFPFVIAIPSAIRYKYRELKYLKKGITPPTKYDDIWFEGDATRTGYKYREYLNQK